MEGMLQEINIDASLVKNGRLIQVMTARSCLCLQKKTVHACYS